MFFHYDSHSRFFEISMNPEHWLESAIISQIFTDKRNLDDLATGWWAESLEGLEAGSELYQMKRAKLTSENVEMATQSVTNALKYLQDAGFIDQFDVLCDALPGALMLKVQATAVNTPRMVNFGFRVWVH
jgi:phage gp46-like protein